MTPGHLRREITLTCLSVGLTLFASAFLARELFEVLAQSMREEDSLRTLEQGAFIAIIFFLIYGNLLYQFARFGYLRRRQSYVETPAEDLERFHASAPSLTILVPSYREEVDVVRQTLLSAVVQDYPNKRVVLLIDDPPQPAETGARRALQAARDLPGELRGLIDKPALRLRTALSEFTERRREGALDLREETARLAELYLEVASWFEEQAASLSAVDHSAQWFAEFVLLPLARTHRGRSLSLAYASETETSSDAEALEREYRRLAARFSVEVTSFERKHYVNLSHEANKAMNLNSYIALLGGSFRELRRADGLHLERCAPAEAPIAVPDAEFLITLDADSVLAPDYALRLAHFMSQPGNERVAVAQTPYSAFPDPPDALERVAGATTDMQYIVHQGSSHYDAAYWVGANAMLRRAALDDIRVSEQEHGFEISRFIQDRTVIEDTESSIDLVARGWSVYNHPDRLAYSATPPDFGALTIQRRRWANGGLLILGKLVRHLGRSPWQPRKLAEALFRCHYLVSIAGVNLGLLALLTYPFEEPARQAWIVVAAAPYFALYGRDLMHNGYRFSDLLRVYAINLMLLPVNLGGVFQSIRQGLTGRKSSFVRTPKVEERTVAPAVYLLAQHSLLATMAVVLVLDLFQQRWVHASFILVNGGMLLYALHRFIGVRKSLEDVRLQLRPARVQKSAGQ